MMSVTLVSGMASCSSDDNEDGIGGGNEGSKLAPITVKLSAADGDGTRAALSNNVVGKVKNKWYEEDIVWAYSPSKHYYNKLKPSADEHAQEGYTEMTFHSEGDVDYTVGERLILLYSGDKDGNASNPGNGDNNPATGENTVIFERSENGNDMFFLWGNDTRHFADNYIDANGKDRGNPYHMKTASATILDNGNLANGNDSKINLRSYIPLLRITLPATDFNNAQELAKLDYKITLRMKQGDNIGYPSKLTFEYLTGNALKYQDCLQYVADNPVEWDNNDLVLTLTHNGTTDWDKSSSIWYDNTGENGYDNVNKPAGQILIPFPALEYDDMSIKVEVTNPDNVSGLDAFVGTYVYTLPAGSTFHFDLTDEKANAVYPLGNVWTNGSNIQYSTWTKIN